MSHLLNRMLCLITCFIFYILCRHDFVSAKQQDKIITLKSNSITHADNLNDFGKDEILRIKRATSREERERYVDTHNRLRRKEDAANMNILHWHNDLAEMARLWAEQCVWRHGQPNYANRPFVDIGQNLYATTGQLDIEAAIQNWYNEKDYYDHEDNSCVPGEQCGHYTQVVWDDTSYVACAYAYCSNLAGLIGAQYLVCNYGPPGNYPRSPYTKGKACSKCGSGSFWCDDGLCTTSCTGSSSKCKCAADCRNCGKTEESTCSCECAPGWTGVDCSRNCANYRGECNANPGWPPSWCSDQYPYVLEHCPLMCGICEAADPADTCDESDSANQNLPVFKTLIILIALSFQILFTRSEYFSI